MTLVPCNQQDMQQVLWQAATCALVLIAVQLEDALSKLTPLTARGKCSKATCNLYLRHVAYMSHTTSSNTACRHDCNESTAMCTPAFV